MLCHGIDAHPSDLFVPVEIWLPLRSALTAHAHLGRTTMAANPDNRYGKHIYRPELVNVAWVHEAANTAADNGVLHPSGKAYRSAHINAYRTGTPHETYFVHFSPSHWKEEAAKHTRKHPNEKFPTRQFEYPADFRGKVLNGIRESILAAL